MKDDVADSSRLRSLIDMIKLKLLDRTTVDTLTTKKLNELLPALVITSQIVSASLHVDNLGFEPRTTTLPAWRSTIGASRPGGILGSTSPTSGPTADRSSTCVVYL
jgi:hypothetical protein